MKDVEKKPLPFSVSKKRLVELYCNQMPEKTITKGINEIIFENRKNLPENKHKTREQIVYARLVWHTEFMEFVGVYGAPKGYKNPENE